MILLPGRVKHTLLVFAFAIPCLSSHAQNPVIDSLLSVIQKENTDTTTLSALADLGRQYFLISDYTNAERYSMQAIRQAETGLASGTLSRAERESMLRSQSKGFNNIGNSHYFQGDNDKAVEYHLKALKIREELGDKRLVAGSENNIANILFRKGQFDKALQEYEKAAGIFREVGDRNLEAMATNNIGLVYEEKLEFDKALEYLQKALKIREGLGDPSSLAASYNNIGINYKIRNNFAKAEEYYLKALKIMLEMGDKVPIATAYNNLGDLYFRFKKVAEAKKMQLLSLKYAKEAGAKPTLLYSYMSLAGIDSVQGNFREAYDYHSLYIQTKDSVFNEQSDKSMQEMQTKYDSEKKQHEIELLTKDGELLKTQGRVQKIIIGSVIAGLLLVIFFAIFIFNRLRLTRKQKAIIEEQKSLVDIKNKHITDSINYAKRIQDSILPSHEEFKKYFFDYFLFFRPKDIVSGDFYWLSDHQGKTVLVVADCTGHGVPGAFMSMIGNTLLNEIVNEQHIIQPAEILNQLNEGIIQALHQESRNQDDGMDVSVCLFDKTENTVTFAGANHSLYVTEDNSIREIKGDIYSIGSMFGPKDPSGQNRSVSFTQKEISLKKNSTVYFSTDGFPDQIGGEKGKKFLLRQLEKMLQNLASLDMKEQEQTIVKTFEAWKGKYNQLDDVLLVGIKPWR